MSLPFSPMDSGQCPLGTWETEEEERERSGNQIHPLSRFCRFSRFWYETEAEIEAEDKDEAEVENDDENEDETEVEIEDENEDKDEETAYIFLGREY